MLDRQARIQAIRSYAVTHYQDSLQKKELMEYLDTKVLADFQVNIA